MAPRKLTILLGLMLTACSGGGGSSVQPPVTAQPEAGTAEDFAIPRLAAGPHMGIIVGFDDLSGGYFDREANARQLMDDAAAAGASISRIQTDWSGLETAPGVYDDTTLAALLEEGRARGQKLFVTLSTLDSEGLTVPADLVDANGRFLPGRSLDSPEVLQRFAGFLDWFLAQLSDEVWAIALGNEVDSAIVDDFASPTEALAFYRRAVKQVAASAPGLAVTVTLTLGAPVTLPAFTDGLMAVQDIATFNHYCLDEFFLVTEPARWAEDVQRMKDAAGDLPIMIQELGCPVGYGDDGMGAPTRPANGLAGSPETQVAYFEYFDQLFRTDPQFRAATVFQLYDWSPELASLFGDQVRSEGETVIADRFEEWLATIGLCRWADGTCRPAWDTFLQALRNQADVRR